MFGSLRPGRVASPTWAARRRTWSPGTRRRVPSGPWGGRDRGARDMVDQDYGGRGGTVADPEGNQWSFGELPASTPAGGPVVNARTPQPTVPGVSTSSTTGHGPSRRLTLDSLIPWQSGR